MCRRFVLLMGILVLAPTMGQAAITITVPNWTLFPNLSNQIVDAVNFSPLQLTASGADLVDGMVLRTWINGGVGPAPFLDGIRVGGGTGAAGFPTAVQTFSHLLAGGFGGINNDPNNVANGVSTGLSTAASILVFTPVAADSAPFVSFSFSTVGVLPGTYSFSLTNPGVLGPTTFLTDSASTLVPTALVYGTVSGAPGSDVVPLTSDPTFATITVVVPEPGSLVLLGFGVVSLVGCCLRARKRRRFRVGG